MWAATRPVVALLMAQVAAGGCSQGIDEPPRYCEVVEGFDGACPDDMAFVPGTNCCIDRYEASLDGSGEALSVPGVLPAVRVAETEAEEACAAAGKTLCPGDVWTAACTAGGERAYPYGNEYRPLACSEENSTGELVPTGSMADCEGGVDGVFDMSGNAVELAYLEGGVMESLRLRGGMYLTGNVSVSCSSSALAERSDHVQGAGFRCCALAAQLP